MNEKICSDSCIQIERIIKNEQCYVIDVFPKRIESWNNFKIIESYLLKRKQKTQYVNKIINILLKTFPYDEAICCVQDCKKNLKKYEGIFYVRSVNTEKFISVLKKLIKNDEVFFILLKQANIVISVGLYNTAVYGSECQEMNLIEKIVLSEGMFFCKE